MTLLVFLIVLGVIGVILLIHAVLFAPEGNEDSEGFHYTTPQQPGATTSVPPVLTAADLGFFS